MDLVSAFCGLANGGFARGRLGADGKVIRGG